MLIFVYIGVFHAFKAKPRPCFVLAENSDTQAAPSVYRTAVQRHGIIWTAGLWNLAASIHSAEVGEAGDGGNRGASG